MDEPYFYALFDADFASVDAGSLIDTKSIYRTLCNKVGH